MQRGTGFRVPALGEHGLVKKAITIIIRIIWDFWPPCLETDLPTVASCPHFVLRAQSRSQIWVSDSARACSVESVVLTLCDPMDCCPPGSSVHEDSPGKNTGVGCHALLQEIFPTQGSNPCLLWLLHCKRILLPLESLGKPQMSDRLAFKSYF